MPGMRYQPQGTARIDRAGLGSILAASYVPSIGINPVSGEKVALGQNVTRATSRDGVVTRGAASNAAIDIGVPGGIDSLVAGGVPFTVFFRLNVTLLNTRQIFIGDFNASGASESFNLEVTADNRWRFSAWAGGTNRNLGGGAVTLGWHDVMAVRLPGIGHALYVDREFIGLTPYTDSLRSGVALRLGMPGLANSVGFQGQIALCHIFRGDLREQRGSLSDNPWQVFAEAATEEGEDQPAAVGHVLVVEHSALSMVAGQVGMKVSRRLRAAPAALAVSQGQVALRAARRISVQSASLALLAGSARMLVSRRFGVQPAALAMAGQGVTLRAGRRLRVEPAALGLAGGQVGMQYAPTLVPGSYTLPVSAAAIALATGWVGAHVARRLEALPAVFAVAGGAVRMAYTGAQEDIDAFLVPARQTVVFEGARRVVTFEGSKRVVSFEGSKRLVEFQ